MEAQAHGTGSEQERLLPAVTAIAPLLMSTSLITADASYHSERNLQALGDAGREALIADNDMRRRDERFAMQGRHQAAPDPLHDKSTPEPEAPGVFPASAFECVHLCRGGANLRGPRRQAPQPQRPASGDSGHDLTAVSGEGARLRAMPAPGTLHPRSMRAAVRSVNVLPGKRAPLPETQAAQIKRRIDAPEGRARYGRRFETVEPVFANVCYNKGLDRFTLRG